ncbi:MAG: hypothetical protein KJO07_14840 [Deltaproteobacteria bacterium]|nr:hypothetical protein [Deltaproteobacteria bacterium]
MSNLIELANWKINWRITETAGIQIFLCDYKGSRVVWEASLPYVTIDHQRQDVDLDDESTEAHGPFWMPLGGRSLAGPVRTNTFKGGFEIAADFVTGPFQYTQLWRFHEDGRFAPWLTIHGGGVHDEHTYHPHWRFDFDVDGALDDALEHYEDGRWNRVADEGWLPATEQDDDGGVWRQVDFGSGHAVTIRPHSWEDAELFALRYHPGEAPPYSPRAEAGSQPFPAAYVGSEGLDGQDVTLWYVAHVHYDSAFPFTAGPWVRVTQD